MLNTVTAFLLGGSNFFVAGVIALVASYMLAIWYTKRFLDIKPKINAKLFWTILFIFIFALNIFTYIQFDMMEELKAFSDYIVIHGLGADGAPTVSKSTVLYATSVSVARAILGILLSIFTFILFIKKG